jgi:restriction endonuclease Mrr
MSKQDSKRAAQPRKATHPTTKQARVKEYRRELTTELAQQLNDPDPKVRRLYREFVRILVSAYERGGYKEVRRVLERIMAALRQSLAL